MSCILLILDHKENRRLLEEVLASRYDLIVPSSDSALSETFDLGIVDGRALDRLQRQVSARKQAEQPAILPFLLVTSRQDVGMATRHLWASIDELIISPIEKVELLARVSSLMTARRLSMEVNRIVIQSSPLAIIVVDRGGRISQWNPAAERLFGWSQAEVLGQPHSVAAAEADDAFDRLLSRVLQGEQATGVETRRQRKDGSLVDISIAAAPLRDASSAIVSAIAVVEDITERKQAEEALRQSRDQLRELTVRLAEAEERERCNLSHELHDSVGQRLTALNINLGIVKRQLSADAAQTIRSRIDDSLHLIAETVACVRDVMADLYPPILEDFGLGETLRWYAQQFTRRTEIPVQLEETGNMGRRLAPHLEAVLFRVAQEALTNIARHAGAKHALINLDVIGNATRLTVGDDGRGFDPLGVGFGERKSWGLHTMRERIEGAGGRFRVESVPGKGTKIVAEITSPPLSTS